MYVRRIEGEEVSFGFTGVLWRENVVIYDRGTGSWWAQALGRAINGEMEGKTLEMFPSSLMTWKQWRQLHPETRVMSVPPVRDLEQTRQARRRYHNSLMIGATGRTGFVEDEIGPKTPVVSFKIDGRPLAVVLGDVNRDQVLQTTVDTLSLVAVATPDGSMAKIFFSGDHAFGFVRDEGGRKILRDEATGSEWDGFQGRATSGPLAGTLLEEIPSFVAYWFASKAFFPDPTVIGRD